jgi:hypothetical protein
VESSRIGKSEEKQRDASAGRKGGQVDDDGELGEDKDARWSRLRLLGNVHTLTWRSIEMLKCANVLSKLQLKKKKEEKKRGAEKRKQTKNKAYLLTMTRQENNNRKMSRPPPCHPSTSSTPYLLIAEHMVNREKERNVPETCLARTEGRRTQRTMVSTRKEAQENVHLQEKKKGSFFLPRSPWLHRRLPMLPGISTTMQPNQQWAQNEQTEGTYFTPTAGEDTG